MILFGDAGAPVPLPTVRSPERTCSVSWKPPDGHRRMRTSNPGTSCWRQKKIEQTTIGYSAACCGNQLWAGQAPVLMLSVAKLVFEEDQSPNRHALHDVGLAVENLIVQAIALEVFVHQMAGFELPKARELFQIPAHHEPVAMIALGYLGD